MKRVVCAGCSLLCDDILINTGGLFIDQVIGACLKAKERIDQVTDANRILNPMIRKGEELVKVSWDEALEKTVEILKSSSDPLLYGFSTTTCEAQMRGIELAKQLNGFIDSNSSICQGKFLTPISKKGATLSTLSEVINKADILIFWGANPAESIPRLLNKVIFSRGKFRLTGREVKTLIVIDPIKTSTFNVMGARDLALNIKIYKDIELIRFLKEKCCTDEAIPSEGIAGIDKNDLKRLLLNITESENTVIFSGQGLLDSPSNTDLLEELLELIEEINQKQAKGRTSLIMMSGHYNMVGFEHVLLSTTGHYGSAQFKEGKIEDTTDNIVTKLQKGEGDCSIIVGSDPISHLPGSLSSKMMAHPIILLDSKKSSTSYMADVILPTALTGIEASGLAYRLDHVPIELHKIIDPPKNILSDEEVLSKIIAKLKSE